MVFKKKQSAVDEQIAEIDKLNAVINAAERDMLKLRKVCAKLCIGSGICPLPLTIDSIWGSGLRADHIVLSKPQAAPTVQRLPLSSPNGVDLSFLFTAMCYI